MNNGATENIAELTDYERLKLENFGLKHNALQRQQQDNLTERAAFIQQMEAAHPGFKWEEQKGLVSTTAEPQPTAKGSAKPGARPQ